ncbi:D-alanyl-D-alanine carboxypeptidase family protein [Kribbella endophytica]
MSQTFSLEGPTAAADSLFRPGVLASEYVGEDGGLGEREVPDRELEVFELLHAQLEPGNGGREPAGYEDETGYGDEAEELDEAEQLQDDSPEASVVEGEAEHPISAFFRVPVAAIEALGKGSYAAAVALLGPAGHRSENDLTNVIFYFRHPEVLGRKILPHERDLQQDWITVRNTIVRPILQRLATAPASAPATTGRTGISSAGLRWYGRGEATDELMVFMRAVYDRQVKQSDGGFVDTLPDSALGKIVGRHRALKPAAEQVKALLDAAEAALAAEGPPRVAIGITSAYRSADEQWAIWQGKGHGGAKGFPHYYAATKKQRGDQDPHGPAAVDLLARLMKKCIAAPGYSNHQDGLAVDFGTAETGHPLGKIGPNSWFHKWLVANAHRFDFGPYATEAWHWVYKPKPATATEAEAWQPEELSSPDEGDEDAGQLAEASSEA